MLVLDQTFLHNVKTKKSAWMETLFKWSCVQSNVNKIDRETYILSLLLGVFK